MEHQIIFLNGPRHSGKDTAAKYIMREWIQCRHRKFAGPVKAACAAVFCIDENLFHALETEGSTLKLAPRPEFFGASWVDTLIWFSENCMKPRYGRHVFGKLMANELRKPTSTVLTVISDCGFSSEVHPVVDEFGVKNCHLFRLYRDDKTFDGDSRSYIFENDLQLGLHIEDIHNIHDLKFFRIQILRRVDKIMGREKEYDISS